MPVQRQRRPAVLRLAQVQQQEFTGCRGRKLVPRARARDWRSLMSTPRTQYPSFLSFFTRLRRELSRTVTPDETTRTTD